MISPALPIPGDLVIDVSHWAGLIRWPEVAKADPPIRAAGIKLTEGQHTGDPLGAFNARRSREVGIEPIFYHFLRPATDATAQIAVFAAALYGAHHSPREAIALDVESTGGLVPSRMKAAVIAAYRRVLLETQTIPEIYTRMSFWKSCVGVIDWTALGLPIPSLWAADYGWYGDGRPLKEPRWIAGSGWTGWRRWQYTDRGRVPGIDASVDLNVEA